MDGNHEKIELLSQNQDQGQPDGELFLKKTQEVYDATMEDDVDTIKQIFNSLTLSDQIAMLVQDNDRASPVLVAFEHNSKRCLEYFLEKHEEHSELMRDQDEVDAFTYPYEEKPNQNAFHLLARREREPKMLEILEKFSDYLKNLHIIDCGDRSDITPLMVAMETNAVAVAKYLIDNNAEFQIVHNKQSPISIAVMKGQVDLVKRMLQKVPEEKKGKLLTHKELFGEGHSILYPAALSGNNQLMIFLMEEMGPDTVKETLRQEVNHSKHSKMFIKHICISGMSETMEMMMKEMEEVAVGKATKSKDDDKTTPLMWAAKGSQLEIVELILKSRLGKATFEMKDEQDRNVFHYAACPNKNNNNNDVLKYLMEICLEKEHDYSNLINGKDTDGCTPAHYAAVAGLDENVWLLLGDTAKMNKQSIFHCENCLKTVRFETIKTMLKKYQENDKEACHRALTSFNQKRRIPVHEAALVGNTDVLELLVDTLPSTVHLRSSDLGWTPLHFAVASRSLDTVKFIVEKYPKMVSIKSDYDRTAASVAAESGCAEIIKYLLTNGAKVFGESLQENLLECVTRHSYTANREPTCLEIVKFCNKNQDVNLMKKLMENTKDGPEGIMSTLLKLKMTKAVQEILDGCLRRSTDEKFVNIYHFFPIQDNLRRGKSLLAIESMLTNQCLDCLGHPVVVKFLDKKWQCSTAKRWYTSNIVLYIVFLLSLTIYIGLESRGLYNSSSPGLIGLCLASMTVIVLNVIKEMFQLAFNWKEYFTDPNNYIEWTMYVSATVYLWPYQEEGKTKAQIEAGAIAVFIAWINFIWFFKRLSLFGIYIIMAKKVFTSLLKVLPMVVLFIFAFSMAFSLLTKTDEGYTNIPLAMLTTAVMMTGEIDYRDEFLGENTGPHAIVKRLFLLGFLCIIIIVIMNLLVGLAVGDTDDIMKRSKAEKRYYKATLIVALERSLSSLSFLQCFGFHGLKKVKDPHPEKKKEEVEKTKYWFIRLWARIYLDTELDDIDETKEILSKVEKMEKAMQKIDDENKEILSKLDKICNEMVPRNTANVDK